MKITFNEKVLNILEGYEADVGVTEDDQVIIHIPFSSKEVAKSVKKELYKASIERRQTSLNSLYQNYHDKTRSQEVKIKI